MGWKMEFFGFMLLVIVKSSKIRNFHLIFDFFSVRTQTLFKKLEKVKNYCLRYLID